MGRAQPVEIQQAERADPTTGRDMDLLFKRSLILGLMACCGTVAFAADVASDGAPDVAIVTSVHGKATRNGVPLETLGKVGSNDEIQLGKGARLQLMYVDGGRVESWRGSAKGRLKVGGNASEGSDLPEPEVRQLPAGVAKQIARAPAFDGQGNVVTSRFRSIPTPASIAAIEAQYRKLRSELPQEDLSPELYLLSGMFELQELERVERTLAELRKDRPQDPQVKLLASLYGKAIRDARSVK